MNQIIIHSFTLPHEAHLAKTFLESHGITVELRDELTTQVDNFLSNAIGGIKLQVPEEEAQRTLTLLQEAGYINTPQQHKKEKTETILIKSKSEMTQCPYCQSDNISEDKTPHWLITILWCFFSILFPIYKKHYHCFDCNKDWKFKIEK